MVSALVFLAEDSHSFGSPAAADMVNAKKRWLGLLTASANETSIVLEY
jgi:hypothetical protein